MTQEAQPVLAFNLEGWEVGQEGGDLCTPVADTVLMCGRSQHNIVKQLSSN